MSAIISACQESTEKQEAIILAGGLGTRLRSAVPDLPKCMAPVAGQPFLYYLINYLRMQGIEKLVFSLGYKHEQILNWLESQFPSLDYDFVIEQEPLGTGGAVRLALQKTHSPNIFVLNGDTLFKFDAARLLDSHLESQADCTLALKPMRNFDRYGVVTLGEANQILRFEEKKAYASGLINAGVYLLNRQRYLELETPERFSFEKDYLEPRVQDGIFSGISMEGYFIDIGIPEDYQRAQDDFKRRRLQPERIDRNWTLFLDRDGVINQDKPGGYITDAAAFQFTEGLPGLFSQLREKFKRLIVVTNQRGVGRGIIQPEDLDAMHEKLLTAVRKAGGDIDHLYYSTAVSDKAFYRKPNPGMALQAARDFPDIDFDKALMIGNSFSDMHFGRNAGMHTVFITSTHPPVSLPDDRIDLQFESLQDWFQSLPR